MSSVFERSNASEYFRRQISIFECQNEFYNVESNWKKLSGPLMFKTA